MAHAENSKTNIAFFCSGEKANVFLIGDSIRLGYCETVKKELTEKAEVFYVGDNCRSTQYTISSLETWKNKFDNEALVDIVHFNCGHWDIAKWGGYNLPLTSEDEYAKNIKMIIDLLKIKFKNAKIIFATTTAINPDNLPSPNPRDNVTVDRYNEIAVNVAKANGVFVNDLNKLTRNWSNDYYADHCHFTNEAYTVLGKAVADKIKELL